MKSLDSRGFESLLRLKLKDLGGISVSQAEVMRRHYELLMRWNRTVSLTTITKLEEVVERHYAESVLAAFHVERGTPRIADVGSGAGFPGFPIAVIHPESSVTLVESVQRKAAFLRETIDLAPNLSVINARAESLTQTFDMLTTRAVRPKDVLHLIPRVAPAFLILISQADAEEIQIHPRYTCEAPIPIPWSERTVILKGRCSFK